MIYISKLWFYNQTHKDSKQTDKDNDENPYIYINREIFLSQIACSLQQ